MEFPNCSEPMRQGEVRLKKSFWNTLAFGWGSTELIFRDDLDKKDFELMNSWEFGRAYFCGACGSTVIATDLGAK